MPAQRTADDRSPTTDAVALLGRDVTYTIDTPRGGHTKRRPDGSAEFRTPIGAPFNYGDVVGELGGDGDPLDAIVLGPPLARGATGVARVHAVVRFVDEGRVDDKLICLPPGVSPGVTLPARLALFFAVYARFKRVRAVLAGRSTDIRSDGVLWADATA